MKGKNKAVALAYLGIIFVVIIWGLSPTAKKAFIGDSFSAFIYSTITSLASALALLVISIGRLGHSFTLARARRGSRSCLRLYLCYR